MPLRPEHLAARPLIHVKGAYCRAAKVSTLCSGQRQSGAASTEPRMPFLPVPVLAAFAHNGDRQAGDGTFSLPMPKHRLERPRLGG